MRKCCSLPQPSILLKLGPIVVPIGMTRSLRVESTPSITRAKLRTNHQNSIPKTLIKPLELLLYDSIIIILFRKDCIHSKAFNMWMLTRQSNCQMNNSKSLINWHCVYPQILIFSLISFSYISQIKTNSNYYPTIYAFQMTSNEKGCF